MRLILLVLLVLLICGGIGAGPWWGYSGGWGYAPVGGLGIVILIVVLLLIFGL